MEDLNPVDDEQDEVEEEEKEQEVPF